MSSIPSTFAISPDRQERTVGPVALRLVGMGVAEATSVDSLLDPGTMGESRQQWACMWRTHRAALQVAEQRCVVWWSDGRAVSVEEEARR